MTFTWEYQCCWSRRCLRSEAISNVSTAHNIPASTLFSFSQSKHHYEVSSHCQGTCCSHPLSSADPSLLCPALWLFFTIAVVAAVAIATIYCEEQKASVDAMPWCQLLFDACERVQSILQGTSDSVRELEEDAQEQVQSISQLGIPCVVSSAWVSLVCFSVFFSTWLLYFVLFVVVDHFSWSI